MIIVGAGRVGTALATAADAAGVSCSLVSRTSGHQALSDGTAGPILLAVRNNDLDPVIQAVPAERRDELVLIQNGMLRPFIASRGLRVTRGLLFFAVPSLGAPLQPGNPSPFTGPRAADVVSWFESVGVAADRVDDAQFAEVELEKLIWNCAFGLLSQHFDATVDLVVTRHADTLRELVDELASVGRTALGVDLELDPLLKRLSDYSLSIAGYQGSVKEWNWRNGWFVEAARSQQLPTPLHDSLLGAQGLLSPDP